MSFRSEKDAFACSQARISAAKPQADLRLKTTKQTTHNSQNSGDVVMNNSSVKKLKDHGAFQSAAEVFRDTGTDWVAIGGQAANDYRASDRQTIDYDF